MSGEKTWAVTGTVEGGCFVGNIKASSAKEAIEKGWARAHVSLCHSCARKCSDLEVSALTAECEETGEVYETNPEPEHYARALLILGRAYREAESVDDTSAIFDIHFKALREEVREALEALKPKAK